MTMTEKAIERMDIAIEELKQAIEQLEAIDEKVNGNTIAHTADHVEFYQETLKVALRRVSAVYNVVQPLWEAAYAKAVETAAEVK